MKSNKLMLCRVLSVTDGDTIKIAMKPFFFSRIYQFNIRLLGYDAPETRTTDANEKIQGLIAKGHLQQLLHNIDFIYIKCSDFDNFGRILGELYFTQTSTKSINTLMTEFCNTLQLTYDQDDEPEFKVF